MKKFLSILFSISMSLLMAFVAYVLLTGNPQDASQKFNKYYENQIHASEIGKFVDENAKNIIGVAKPLTKEEGNLFQIITDAGNGSIKTYTVYKKEAEKWDDFKKQMSYLKPFKEVAGGYTEQKKATDWASIISTIISALFMGVILYSMKGMFKFGAVDTIRLFSPSKEKAVLFEDIGGIEQQKADIQSVVENIANWEKFKKAGVRPIRGILFYGGPGTGKTMTAQAIASSLGIDMFIASGSDFRGKYLNEGATKVKAGFKKVKDFIEKHKTNIGILFIDEIDTVLRNRDEGHSEDGTVVNQFLSEMNGIEGDSNVIVIGATNRLDKIDEAALSRFDKKIFFPMPSLSERHEIIMKTIAKAKKSGVRVDEKEDFMVFAHNTIGKAGRDIDNIINEAKRVAISKNRVIDAKLIQEVFSDVEMGKETGRKVSDTEKSLIGWHELGHAIIGFTEGKMVHTVTVRPRGFALGLSWSVDRGEVNLETPERILANIRELLAGRASEKYFVGHITTGASNDYERATKIANAYFTSFNFDYKGKKLGMVVNKNNEDNPMVLAKIADTINPWVKEMLADQENEVEKMIVAKEQVFRNLHGKLLSSGTIFYSDIAEQMPEEAKDFAEAEKSGDFSKTYMSSKA